MRNTATFQLSIILTLGISLIALPAAAQNKVDPAKTTIPSEPTLTTASYGNWILRCVQLASPAPGAADAGKAGPADAKTCEVVQTVQVQGQSQPIAQVAIGRLPGEKDLMLTALVPVSISLPGAIHLSGNGKSGSEEKGGLDLSWQRCLANSCAATAKPDPAFLAILRSGTGGQLRFIDASGQTAEILLSWKGLDQAMAALDKAR
ncbi:invasion associated locus B family protein [Rhizobium sp. FY34]|uniref:invasion associated locus B family protein n=1 Tax=Rhizobium sp. FY34 TaxID=2562309 RepID=UPI0014859418|nr:invasion associated locus B family protein [Rhizobium sp. FY34]